MSRIERCAFNPSARQLIDDIRQLTNGCNLEDALNATVFVLAEIVAIMQRELEEYDAVEVAIEALRGNSADMLAVQSTIQ